MKIRIFLMMMLVICISLLMGCNEEQRLKVDRAAEEAEKIGAVVEDATENPIVRSIAPPGVLEIISYVLGVGGVIVGGWQNYRKKQSNTAIKEIVSGVESYKQSAQTPDRVRLSSAFNTSESAQTKKKVAIAKSGA